MRKNVNGMSRFRTMKKICVIGAGPAGLAAAKNSLEYGYECDVFEQTGLVGGIWNYTDDTEMDENGLPIHTAMYQNLRTNLPKEVMEYLEYSYPKETQKSYLTQPEVLEYIQNFSKRFNLEKTIKFYHQVINIKPLEKNRWSVRAKNIKTETIETRQYDAVMICTGHYHKPNIPNFPGQEQFAGNIVHSKHYRKSDPYKNRDVLIIGAGPSSYDISGHIAEIARKVVVSKSKEFPWKFHDKVIHKPTIKSFEKDGVVFQDGSKDYFDDVLLCTGYLYNFPFLDETCGIRVRDNCVEHLYKHVLNVDYPTMGFIGIPYHAVTFPLFDLQIKFFLAFVSGRFELTKNMMMKEIQEDIEARNVRKWPTKQRHRLDVFMNDYVASLTEAAGLQPFPTAILNIYWHVKESGRNTQENFRIVNEDTFVCF